jgi:hypothetical protein
MARHYPLSCLESFFSLPLGSGSLAFFTIVSTSFVVRSHCGPGYQDRPMCPKRNLSEPYVFLNKACHDLIPDVLASPR